MKRPCPPIVCCGFTPCVQRVLSFSRLNKYEVNRALKVETGVGGKGANTARVLAQLGADPLLLGFAGGANGRRLEAMLEAESIRFRHVETVGETRICQTLLETGAGDSTELVEEMPPLEAAEWPAMVRLLERTDLSGWVSISGKLPAGAPEDAYRTVVRLVRRAGGRVVLDVPGRPLLQALEEKPCWVKMNDHELRLTLGAEGSVPEGMARLLERGAQRVLVTRGGDTAFFADASGFWEVVPPEIRPLNPVGSGDAATAGLMLALAEGRPDEEAVVRGMASGAANALNLHCGVVKQGDVVRLLDGVRLEPLDV